jgi:hypothetical protein
MESETTSKESSMRNEVMNTNQMVGTLREEMERRLKDVMVLREERDALAVSFSWVTGWVLGGRCVAALVH